MVREPHQALVHLLHEVKLDMVDQLHEGLLAAGHGDLREGRGQLFRFLGPEGIRLTDLAEALRMTKQATAEHVAQLERDGYVERLADPADGRAKLVVPTSRGLEAQRVALGLLADIEERRAALIGSERMAQLRGTLEDLVALERPVDVLG